MKIYTYCNTLVKLNAVEKSGNRVDKKLTRV